MKEVTIQRYLLDPDKIEAAGCDQGDPASPVALMMRRDVGYPFAPLDVEIGGGQGDVIARLQQSGKQIGKPLEMTVWMRSALTEFPIYIANGQSNIAISAMGGLGYQGGATANAVYQGHDYLKDYPYQFSLDYSKDGVPASSIIAQHMDWNGVSGISLQQQLSPSRARQYIKSSVSPGLEIVQDYSVGGDSDIDVIVTVKNVSSSALTDIYLAHGMRTKLMVYSATVYRVSDNLIIGTAGSDPGDKSVSLFSNDSMAHRARAHWNPAPDSALQIWNAPILSNPQDGFYYSLVFNIPSLDPGQSASFSFEVRHGGAYP